MDHRQLGRSGLKVSALCLGTMTFGESSTFMKGVTSDDAEARRVLDRALDAGIDLLDTANVYSEGRSEELLGTWLEGRRQRVLLATKCRFAIGRTSDPNEAGLSRRAILAACEASLKRLKTDWIDLYQVHMQDGATPIDETLRALDDLVTSGKIRYIGCSNYTGYRLTESLWAADDKNLSRYESVQLQWSLLERGAEREVLPACRNFRLGVLVWSPLCRGFLSGKYRRNSQPPKGSRLEAWKDTWAKYNNEHTWRVVDEVEAVAKELNSTPSRISLAWLLAKPLVSSVILGARDVRQLDDNLQSLELKLSPEHVGRLDSASELPLGYPYDFISSREPL